MGVNLVHMKKNKYINIKILGKIRKEEGGVRVMEEEVGWELCF